MTLLLLSQIAAAGSGPWVPGAGRLHLYAGIEEQRFRTLNAVTDEGTEKVDIGQGIDAVIAVVDATYGIGPRAAVEVIVPFQYTHAKRPDEGVCAAFGEGACASTTSVGVIEARVKGLLTDEVNGAPVSLAAGLVTRFGGLTSKDRHRFTNAGEGTLDVGARLSAGKSGALGSGYWVASLDAEGLYRLPNTDRFPLQTGTRSVPAPQFSSGLDVLVAPRSSIAFGPTTALHTRPGGLSVGEMLATAIDDVDRFAALRYTTVRVGGKLILQDKAYNSIAFSVTRTVYAVNNPNDTLAIAAGVSLNNLLNKED